MGDLLQFQREADKAVARLRKTDGLEKGGGPPHDVGMEARVAKLESLAESAGKRLDRIDIDLRMVIGAIVTSFLILGGMFLNGYSKLDGRIAALEISSAKADVKLDTILSRLPKP